jgi:hypothetical protein
MSEIISLHRHDPAKNMIVSTNSRLHDEINTVTGWTSTYNMKLNQKTKGFVVSFMKTRCKLMTSTSLLQLVDNFGGCVACARKLKIFSNVLFE